MKTLRIPVSREGMNPKPACIRDFGDRIAYLFGALYTVAKTGGKSALVDYFGSCPVEAAQKLFYSRAPSLMVLNVGATAAVSVGGLQEIDDRPIVPWQSGVLFARSDRELWTSDGTRRGTTRWASLPGDSFGLHLAAGKAATFIAEDGPDSSLGIWRATFSGPPIQISGPPVSQQGTFELDDPPARLGTSLFVPIRDAGLGVVRLVDGDLTPRPLERTFRSNPTPKLVALPHRVIAVGRETETVELFSLSQDGAVESRGTMAGEQDRDVVRIGSRACFPAA